MHPTDRANSDTTARVCVCVCVCINIEILKASLGFASVACTHAHTDTWNDKRAGSTKCDCHGAPFAGAADSISARRSIAVVTGVLFRGVAAIARLERFTAPQYRWCVLRSARGASAFGIARIDGVLTQE